AVSRAIAEVEQFTDAELVTVLAKQSDDYRYAPWLWAGLATLCLTPGMIWLLPDQNPLLLQFAFFVVLLMVLHIPAVTMALVSPRFKRMRAATLARHQFVENNLHKTGNGTGLLIFVSEAEHYVEIIADYGIAEKVPDEEWDAIVQQF